MSVEQSIPKAYALLEKNRAFDALGVLWSALDATDGASATDLLLAHSRMVGHVGDYSEALRVVEDLARREDVADDWRQRCRIWAAIYWSRLGDLQRARELLLASIPPSGDFEYEVLYWSHRLTIATEEQNPLDFNDALENAAKLLERLPGGDDRVELDIWVHLLRYSAFKRLAGAELNAVAVDVMRLAESLRKQSAHSHIYYRLGALRLWNRDPAGAVAEYQRSREVALASNSAFAFLRATVKMLEVHANSAEITLPHELKRKTLIAQAMVVAGQVGLGLLPSPISLRIWRLAEEFPEPERARFRRWLHAERYRPDITRLTGNRFERWCKLFLEEYGHAFFAIAPRSYTVQAQPAGFPGIDLQLVHQHMNAAVQCKGGRVQWSKSRIQGEMLKIRTSLQEFKQRGGTCFVLACTTRLSVHAHETLRIELADIGLDAKFLDETDWDKYLLQDPGLRFQLCLASIDD